MKVALAQIDCQIRNVKANVETMAGMIRRAAEQGCDAVVFPEMSDTGFEMSTIREHAGSWGGPSCRDRTLGEWASTGHGRAVHGSS